MVAAKEKTLRWYRERAGMSILAVADKFFVECSTVSNWERGKHRPNIDLQYFADLYNASVQEIQAAIDRAAKEYKRKADCKKIPVE